MITTPPRLWMVAPKTAGALQVAPSSRHVTSTGLAPHLATVFPLARPVE